MAFAFTAEAGSVSDNHDLLEFIVSEPNELDSMEEDLKQNDVTVFDENDKDISNQLKNLFDAVTNIEYAIRTLEFNLEHNVEAVEQKFKGMFDKLENQEKDAEKRIETLERTSKRTIDKSVTDRIRDLERRTQKIVENSMGSVGAIVESKVSQRTAYLGGWLWPILIVFGLFGGVIGYNAFTVRKMSQRDKLL